MSQLKARYLFLFICVTVAIAFDDVELSASNSILLKALREATNQTQADTLNLPANASSIRENITDTFSCDNKTYGYYADVDNDCQVFHVCLPSQTPSGRNITYRWSFICPNETIFNQEVLTCTRPRDSIDCKDSPEFYHLNMEIGKVPNKTEEQEKKPDNKTPKKTHKRKQDNRKQNIVLENVINEMVDEGLREKIMEFSTRNGDLKSPMLIESVIETHPDDEEEGAEEDLDRIVMERNVRNERQMRRGSFRFKGDV